MRAPNARDTALRVLVSCRTAGAWADAALRAQLRRDGLSGPEAALCSRIVYGVMQNRLLLDFYLGAYCSQKVDHLQPPLLEILRIGAYQILFLDKIPHSAAVNQAVEQAKDNGRAKAAGLVNAVLRQLSRNKVHLPRIPDQDALHSLSIRYSHPKWLVKRLQAILGPETEACLAADNAPAPLTIQVNPLKAAAEELTAELEASGVIVRPHPWVSGCLELDHVGDLTALEPFRMGKFLVQDPAARLVSQIAGVEPGMRVLDLCAGRQVLLRRLCNGGPGGDFGLRPPREQAEAHPGGGGATGPCVHPDYRRRRPGVPAGVGGAVRCGAGRRPLLGFRHHPEEAGCPVQKA